jgi:hypothetical protein
MVKPTMTAMTMAMMANMLIGLHSGSPVEPIPPGCRHRRLATMGMTPDLTPI